MGYHIFTGQDQKNRFTCVKHSANSPIKWLQNLNSRHSIEAMKLDLETVLLDVHTEADSSILQF